MDDKIKKFLEVEKKTKIFDLKINDVHVWPLYRKKIFNKITTLDVVSEKNSKSNLYLSNKKNTINIDGFKSKKKKIYIIQENDIEIIEDEEADVFYLNSPKTMEKLIYILGANQNVLNLNLKTINSDIYNNLFKIINQSKEITLFCQEFQLDLSLFASEFANIIFDHVQIYHKAVFFFENNNYEEFHFVNYDDEYISPFIKAAREKNIKTFDYQIGNLSDYDIQYKYRSKKENEYLPDVFNVYGSYWKNFYKIEDIEIKNKIINKKITDLLKVKKIKQTEDILIISNNYNEIDMISLAKKIALKYYEKIIYFYVKETNTVIENELNYPNIKIINSDINKIMNNFKNIIIGDQFELYMALIFNVDVWVYKSNNKKIEELREKNYINIINDFEDINFNQKKTTSININEFFESEEKINENMLDIKILNLLSENNSNLKNRKIVTLTLSEEIEKLKGIIEEKNIEIEKLKLKPEINNIEYKAPKKKKIIDYFKNKEN